MAKSRIPVRLAVLAAVVTLALGGCGRKGPLEPAAKPDETAKQTGAPAAPKQPFVLDPLL